MSTTLDRRSPVNPRSAGVLSPLGIDSVVLHQGFWGGLQECNAAATLPHEVSWLERVGTLDNFLPPAEREVPDRRGVLFTDSDVYKVLEVVAWEEGRSPDPALEETLQRLTSRIARAMEDDGYINTYWGAFSDRRRYTDLAMGHELYCFGHLIQAAVARFRTHGVDDQLLQLGRRAADHVCAKFGPDGSLPSVDGHPEIEMALVELYRATGEARYLDTAAALVDRRGHGVLGDGPFGPDYYQDDVPVRKATVLRGHAVRALYLAAGAVDVAVETGDVDLLDAVIGQLDATLATRTYITGGMGSRHRDESYGDDFELPSDRSYSETCAGVALIMLAHRLLLATGDMRYGDIVERTLYNIVAASRSPEGTSFFYSNTLHRRTPSTPAPEDSESHHAATGMRAPWFSVPCCPPNVSRMLSTLGTYVATTDDEGVQLHQYAAGTVRTVLSDGRELRLRVKTEYPINGRVQVIVEECPVDEWILTLRIPAWAETATVSVGGEHRPAAPGAFALRRQWAVGDRVILDLPVAPRWTFPDPRIDALRGCVAVEAGPLVFCLESVQGVDDVDTNRFRVDTTKPPVVVEPAIGTHMPVAVCVAGLEEELSDGKRWPYASSSAAAVGDRREAVLVPYFSWATRGSSTMRVWLPTV